MVACARGERQQMTDVKGPADCVLTRVIKIDRSPNRAVVLERGGTTKILIVDSKARGVFGPRS